MSVTFSPCPGCGKSIYVPADDDRISCGYCGAALEVLRADDAAPTLRFADVDPSSSADPTAPARAAARVRERLAEVDARLAALTPEGAPAGDASTARALAIGAVVVLPVLLGYLTGGGAFGCGGAWSGLVLGVMIVLKGQPLLARLLASPATAKAQAEVAQLQAMRAQLLADLARLEEPQEEPAAEV